MPVKTCADCRFHDGVVSCCVDPLPVHSKPFDPFCMLGKQKPAIVPRCVDCKYHRGAGADLCGLRPRKVERGDELPQCQFGS